MKPLIETHDAEIIPRSQEASPVPVGLLVSPVLTPGVKRKMVAANKRNYKGEMFADPLSILTA